MSLHGLIAHFFLVCLNGPQIIHLPTEDILFASKFLAVMNKAAVTSECRFLCTRKFSTPLGKYQGLLDPAKLLECIGRVSLVAQMVKNLPAMQETQVQSLGQEDPLEKGITNHSSIRPWTTPWTEESGGLVHGVTKSHKHTVMV